MKTNTTIPVSERNTSTNEKGLLPNIKQGMSIPRILHQVYFPGWDKLPDETRPSIAALRKANPTWEYRFYDAAGAEAFILRTYGQDILNLYRSIDPAYYAARADVLRYLLCYAEGGVYLDIKSTASRPLDTVLAPDDRFLLSQWAELREFPVGKSAHPELRHVQGCEYVQWFIVSSAGHPFMRAVIETVLRNIENYRTFVDGVGRKGVLRMTGPIAYTQTIYQIRSQYPHRYVHFDTELGFVFSIFGDYKEHRSAVGPHYSDVALPLVTRNRVTTALAMIWFGRLYPFLERRSRQIRRLFG